MKSLCPRLAARRSLEFGQSEIERKHVDSDIMPGADNTLDAIEFAFVARNQP